MFKRLIVICDLSEFTQCYMTLFIAKAWYSRERQHVIEIKHCLADNIAKLSNNYRPKITTTLLTTSTHCNEGEAYCQEFVLELRFVLMHI